MSSFNPYHVYSSTKRVQKKGLSIQKKPVNRIGPFTEKDLEYALSVIRVARPILKTIYIPVIQNKSLIYISIEQNSPSPLERIISVSEALSNELNNFDLSVPPALIEDFSLTIIYNNMSFTSVKSSPSTTYLNWVLYWGNENYIDDNSRTYSNNIVVAHYSYTSNNSTSIRNLSQFNMSGGNQSFIQTLNYDYDINPVGKFTTNITYDQLYNRHIISNESFLILAPSGQSIEFGSSVVSYDVQLSYKVKTEIR